MISLRTPLLGKFTVAGAAMMATATPGIAQHVHGVIELGIVIEENTVSASIHAPLSDVLGFERAAENDQEAERVREAAALIQDANRMFGLPAAAGCDVRDIDLQAPDYLLPDGDHDEHKAEHSDEHEAGHHDEHEAEHHDAEHDDEHNHDDDSEDHAGGHAHGELDAQYIWECADPGAVNALEARFVGGFENVETINIQIITPTGVRVLEGDSRLDRIAVSDP